MRTLSRKPTETETKKLVDNVNRETKDPERVQELAKVQAKLDVQYNRVEERLAALKADLKKLPQDSKEAAALAKQIASGEQAQTATRQRFEANVAGMIYGDILWGLFNSTEFTFNH